MKLLEVQEIRVPETTDKEPYCKTAAKTLRDGDFLEKDGASEGIRTLDPHVGNVMLYQAELRSRPKTP